MLVVLFYALYNGMNVKHMYNIYYATRLLLGFSSSLKVKFVHEVCNCTYFPISSKMLPYFLKTTVIFQPYVWSSRGIADVQHRFNICNTTLPSGFSNLLNAQLLPEVWFCHLYC